MTERFNEHERITTNEDLQAENGQQVKAGAIGFVRAIWSDDDGETRYTVAVTGIYAPIFVAPGQITRYAYS